MLFSHRRSGLVRAWSLHTLLSASLFSLQYLTLLLACSTQAQNFFTHSNGPPTPFGVEDAEEYDKGKWGLYPQMEYQTTDIVGPHLILRNWSSDCNVPGKYYFFCPRGMLVGHAGPTIVDGNGELVWHSEAWPTSYGLTVQKYRGEDYLTFWSGNDQVIGHGSGTYYMLDKNYNQFKMLDANGSLTGDLHEFKITKDHTMLVTSYDNIPWDLRSVGRIEEGWIWDCYFQEIDIETAKVIFSWRATDHFSFDDCYNPVRMTGGRQDPWDWFHINSVDKDSDGNYLISARYSHALTMINGKTGQIMWNIGGKHNDFRDLSDGRATNFSWQHDARWVDDYQAITLFDNSAYFADQNTSARALKLKVDKFWKTVQVVTEAIHPGGYISESQGSAQQLDNGNLMVGYGSVAAFTQFNQRGEVVCDAQFGALHFHKDGSFSPGAVMSYRTYMHNWKGFPTEPPKVKFTDDAVFASWNGATELRSWELEGSSAWGQADWKFIGSFDRTGFESNMTMSRSQQHRMYRLTARDADMHSLGSWVLYSSGAIRQLPLPEISMFRSIVLVVFGSVITLVIMTLFQRRKNVSQGVMSFYRQRRRTNSLTSWDRARRRARSDSGLDSLTFDRLDEDKFDGDLDNVPLVNTTPYANGHQTWSSRLDRRDD